MINIELIKILKNNLEKFNKILNLLKQIFMNDDKNYSSIEIYDKIINKCYCVLKEIKYTIISIKLNNNTINFIRVNLNKINYLIRYNIILVLNNNDQPNKAISSMITFENVFNVINSNFISDFNNLNIGLSNLNTIQILNNDFEFENVNLEPMIREFDINLKLEYIVDDLIENIFKQLQNIIYNVNLECKIEKKIKDKLEVKLEKKIEKKLEKKLENNKYLIKKKKIKYNKLNFNIDNNKPSNNFFYKNNDHKYLKKNCNKKTKKNYIKETKLYIKFTILLIFIRLFYIFIKNNGYYTPSYIK